MQSVEMYQGERRVIGVEVTSCDPEPFTIRNPVYRLKYGETVEVEGKPSVQDHQMTVIIEPLNTGRYTLECEVEIANEVIIRRLPVYVRD